MREKPLVCTWLELYAAMTPLHMNEKAAVDRLHDIWTLGAPEPRSRILNPRGYDPRKRQPGNYEARVVFPTLLKTWIKDVAAARGIPLGDDEVLNVFNGERKG